MVLTYGAYSETMEQNAEKDKEVQVLKEQVTSMQAAQKEILELIKDPDKLLAALERDKWQYFCKHCFFSLACYIFSKSPSAQANGT